MGKKTYTDVAALWRRVRKDHTDLMVRLVLADALEEQGDAATAWAA